jgi:alkylhydroperoxidase AhpD family core domain
MTLLEEANTLFKDLKKSTPAQFDSLHGVHEERQGRRSVGRQGQEPSPWWPWPWPNQCDWCIAIHVANAVKTGASREEILEAAWLAVLMGGGPKLLYLKVVVDELARTFSQVIAANPTKKERAGTDRPALFRHAHSARLSDGGRTRGRRRGSGRRSRRP